jgi:DNA-binding beta-propeller fold protein YncE
MRLPRPIPMLLAAIFTIAPAAAAELELVQKIPLKGKPGNLDHLALDARRDRLLVANKPNNTLDVVDLKTGALIKQVPNQTGIQGIAIAADLDRVIVGLGTNGLCNILNGETYRAVKTIKFADDADNVLYHQKTQMAYVAHAEQSLGVINARTNALKADIKLPGGAESFQRESARPRLYVNIPTPSQIAVIDTDKNEIVGSYPVKLAGGPHPMALDESAKRVYVGCRKEPMVVVLDTESGKELASAPIADGVDDMFLDTGRKRLYASCGDGFVVVLKVVDADHIEVAEKIATVKGARTCLFVPDRGKLYLAVPRQEGKDGPEIWVYDAKP